MIAVLLTTIAFAQLPDSVHSARVFVEPPIAPFHKQVTLTIEVVTNPEVEVKIPQIGPEGFDGLNVYGAPKQTVDLIGEDQRRTAAVYTLDPIQPRDYIVAPVTIDVDGKEFHVPSPAIRIRDLTPEEEAAMLQMAANAPPAEVSEPIYWPWIVLGAVLVTAASGASYWYLRRRPKSVLGPPPKTPWEIAYGRLRALDSAGLPAAGKFGRYYVELSNILRHYVEDRYQLHAPERTTPEFLAEAATSGLLTDDQQALLGSLLKLSDRVKFAQYTSTIAEAEQSMADVLQFVDHSIPDIPAEPEEAAA